MVELGEENRKKQKDPRVKGDGEKGVATRRKRPRSRWLLRDAHSRLYSNLSMNTRQQTFRRHVFV